MWDVPTMENMSFQHSVHHGTYITEVKDGQPRDIKTHRHVYSVQGSATCTQHYARVDREPVSLHVNRPCRLALVEPVFPLWRHARPPWGSCYPEVTGLVYLGGSSGELTRLLRTETSTRGTNCCGAITAAPCCIYSTQVTQGYLWLFPLGVKLRSGVFV